MCYKVKLRLSFIPQIQTTTLQSSRCDKSVDYLYLYCQLNRLKITNVAPQTKTVLIHTSKPQKVTRGKGGGILISPFIKCYRYVGILLVLQKVGLFSGHTPVTQEGTLAKCVDQLTTMTLVNTIKDLANICTRKKT